MNTSKKPGVNIDPLPVHPIDTHIGQRVRARRLLMNMAEDALAGRLGVTVETMAAFEEGRTRIRATHLYELSRALSVPMRFFFQDLPKA